MKIPLMVLASILIVIYFLTARPHYADRNPRFTQVWLYIMMVILLIALWWFGLSH